jgi:uncharacterized protein YaaW (UPF0174 family)
MNENNICDYCLSARGDLYKLKDWDNPEVYKYYCMEHWHQVRKFQKKQMVDYLKYYTNSRERLSKDHNELYKRLEKYINSKL